MEEWHLFRHQRIETWLIALAKLTKSTILALCVILLLGLCLVLLLVLSSIFNLEVVALSATASISSEQSRGRVSGGLEKGHTKVSWNRSEERGHVSRIQRMAGKMLEAPTLLMSPIFRAQTHGIVIIDIRHVIDVAC
jgi:hypothetical protein